MSRSVMTASVSLPAPLCGRCKEQCDYKSGICAGGCLAGWKGRGCSLKCSPREDCRNPCRCARPCLCDTQFQTCTARLCMAVEEGDGITAQGLSLTSTILLVCGCVVAIGVTSVCCLLWRRNSDVLLTGFLANPLCAKCPAFRDCIQKVCAAFGLPCATIRARDSLDSFCDEDEQQVASYSQDIRQWRRGNPTVVGVKTEQAIKRTGTSGYKWKRKWRDRRERSKRKRKEKFAERKLMRAASKASGNGPGTAAGPSLPNAPDNASYSKRGSLILPPLSIGFGSGGGGFRRGSLNPMAMIQQLRRGSVRPGEAAAPAPAASTSPREASAERSEPADAARAASPTASGSASSGQAAGTAGPANTNQESAALSGQAATGDREPSVVNPSPHEAHHPVKQASKEETKEETESGTKSGNEDSGNLKAEDDSAADAAGKGNSALSDRQEEASMGVSNLMEVSVTEPK